MVKNHLTYSPYRELKQKYGNSYIPYEELLMTTEWHDKRGEILRRDGFKCTNCAFKEPLILPGEVFKVTFIILMNKVTEINNVGLSLNTYKEALGISTIDVFRYSGCYYGIDDQNRAISIGVRERLTTEEAFLYCFDHQGVSYPLIGKIGELPKKDFIVLPKVVEKTFHLAVHHKYYVIGSNPWEYDNDALTTLCSDCHSSLHANEKVPVYKMQGSKLIQIDYEICDRCHGTGVLSEYIYYKDGICFKCGGKSYLTHEEDILF